MDICKNTKWLCENTSRLEKYSGQWVSFSPENNEVHGGRSLKQVLQSGASKRAHSIPFVFHVPAADVRTFVPFVKKK